MSALRPSRRFASSLRLTHWNPARWLIGSLRCCWGDDDWRRRRRRASAAATKPATTTTLTDPRRKISALACSSPPSLADNDDDNDNRRDYCRQRWRHLRAPLTACSRLSPLFALTRTDRDRDHDFAAARARALTFYFCVDTCKHATCSSLSSALASHQHTKTTTIGHRTQVALANADHHLQRANERVRTQNAHACRLKTRARESLRRNKRALARH